jgi:hypothetical protein
MFTEGLQQQRAEGGREKDETLNNKNQGIKKVT